MHKISHALGGLESDVSDETIGHDHVHIAAVNVAAFDVADEIQRKLLQQLEGLASQFISLSLFFADGKQSNARTGNVKHAAEIDFAHHRELLKVVRLAINIGTHVEQG